MVKSRGRKKRKVALVTGIGGQDGSYLAELLLAKGYEVHGIRRRTSLFNSARIDHLWKEAQDTKSHLHLHYADLGDSSSLYKIVETVRPDEVYNLGAQSHVGVSFDVPEYTVDIVGVGTIRLLEAVRHLCPKAKFYQASSSEMFGNTQERPQTENTPFYPRSPYGVAKVYAFWAAKNYRESYNMFVCNGILFNHESPRRGRTFVTRKITRAVARFYHKKQDILYLGTLGSHRDWGHAKDFVEAMWLMLQAKRPDDYVISTGESFSVREFAEKAFKQIGIKIKWKGKGLKEHGVNAKTGKTIIKVDPLYFRPAEVDYLLGDPTKAKKELGWKPKYNLDRLIKEMVEFDVKNEGRHNGYVNY